MTLTDLQFLLKLLVSSLLIALVIKFVAPMLPIPATMASAVVMVVTPVLGLGTFLLLCSPTA